MDLYPTFLSLSDIQLPQDRLIDGVDLMKPLLDGVTFDR